PGWGINSPFGLSFSGGVWSIPSEVTAMVVDVGTVPNCKHVAQQFNWGAIETAQDDYDAGYDLVDDFIALCRANGQRANLILMWSAISSGSVAFQIAQG